MKTTTMTALVMIAVSSAVLGVAQEPAGSTGTNIVVVSAQLQNGPAEALCIAPIIGESVTSYCYYAIGDSVKLRDDDAGFASDKLRSWVNDQVHERWATKRSLEIAFQDISPGLQDALKEVRENNSNFRAHAEDLGAIVVEIWDMPVAIRPRSWVGFAIFAHQQAQGAVMQPSSDGSDEAIAKAEQVIQELDSTIKTLQSDLASKIHELSVSKERIAALDQRVLYPTFLGTYSALELALGAMLGCFLIVFLVTGFGEVLRKRSRDLKTFAPESHRNQGSGDIREYVAAIRSIEPHIKPRWARADIRRSCDRIDDSYRMLSDSDSAEEHKALRDLRKAMSQEGIHTEDLSALAPTLIRLFAELRERLGKMVGGQGSNESVRHQVLHIENHLRYIQTSFREIDGQQWTFADLLTACRSLNGAHRELWRELAEVSAVSLDDLKRGSDGRSVAFERLRNAMAVRRCLHEFRSEEDVTSVADHLVRTGSLISGKCRLSSGDSARIPKEVQRIFERLERLARDHFDQGVLWEPVDIIDLAEDRLKKLRSEGEKLRTEAAAVERAIDELGGGHLFVDQFSSLDKLQRVASEISELKRAIKRLKEAGRHNADRANELAKVEALLASRFGNEGLARDQIRCLFDDRDTGLELLQDYRPGGSVSVRATAHAVVQHLEKARQSVQRVLPEATGRIDVLAEEIATSHERLADASKGTRELCRHFSEYLAFDWREFSSGDDVRGYIEVLKRELASEHRPLRLGLSAALVAWKSVRDKLGSLPRGQQIALGLRLPSLQLGLEQISERLQHLSMEELWVKGLRPGFSRGWMHDLFRAELLFECFYARDSKHQDLGDALALATGTLRSVMHRLGKGIESVVLLEDFPIDRPSGWAEPRHLADQELRTLPEVNRRVCDLLDDNRSNFIVDVESFRLCGDHEHSGECRVIVVNPAEWLQAQEASDGIS